MQTLVRGANPSDLERFLALLWQPGDVRELRAPKYNKFKQTLSGYFTDPQTFAAAACTWDGKANIYITLNPVSDSLLARANNRLDTAAEHTTADIEVTKRQWLLLDIDPVRPSGISSTDLERAFAEAVLDRTHTFLSDRGWPEPVLAMSGNGYYALYPVDLPNDAASTALVERLLKELARRFDIPEAHIDTTVSNASRLVGLIGLLKVKGDETANRPHRRAALVQIPNEIVPVTQEQLGTRG